MNRDEAIQQAEETLQQIKNHDVSIEDVYKQLQQFKKGFPNVTIDRPCTVGDGIHVITEDEQYQLLSIFSATATTGRMMKFVPASGAATRMFRSLTKLNQKYDRIDQKTLDIDHEDHQFGLEFIQSIKKFAFYDELKTTMAANNLDIESLLEKDEYKDIFEYTLTDKGLNYADLPKGLIIFHQYEDHTRTSIEEHLAEAIAYTIDQNNIARLHLTVSPEHQTAFEDHIQAVYSRYEKGGITLDISFSNQKPSTDTIAVDMNDDPFRTSDDQLLFRPGGHGALLENLNDLEGDIIFIKNIDNVVPEHLQSETYLYKKILAGYLVKIQEQLFDYLNKLESRDFDDVLLNEMIRFGKQELSLTIFDDFETLSLEEKASILFSKFNRPLRVCGMVKNEGEPGGGPYWVVDKDGSLSLQIVEKSQIDLDSPQQAALLQQSTHFNPVDLVCGVRDYRGNLFDLRQYVNEETGFISPKSYEGRELKALELPGLWNGAMADWNTIFVEVPLITFNPVKTVNDLLRPNHQLLEKG